MNIDHSVSSLRTLRLPADEDIFWFRDDLHQPYPISPFGMTTVQKHHAWSYHHASKKVMLPGSKGAHVKMYKGRVYLGFAVIKDEREIKAREEKFVQNLQYCIDNWDEFYATYISEVKQELSAIEAINADRLKTSQFPDYLKWANDMNRRNWEIHFTTMYMADAIYFTFEEFCKKHGLEEKEFTLMLRGAYETMATKTDREVFRLAQLAEELSLGDKLLDEDASAFLASVKTSAEGNKWSVHLEEFLSFYGNRITAGHLDVIYQTWKEEPTPVLDTIKGYIAKIRDGWDFEQVRQKLGEEREAAIQSFRNTLNKEDLHEFERLLKAAQGVYFFQEDHGFYIDAGSTARLRYAGLACGRRLQRFGLLNNAEDVFFLTYAELSEILGDLAREEDVAVYHYTRLVPSLINERNEDWAKVKDEQAPLTAGNVPENMTDPIGVKVFGIIDDVIHPKGELEAALKLEGFPGAPGIVKGRAKVITHFDGFAKVVPGEILVCPYTSTAWTPLFPKIAAVVTDTGGMLTHAAIAAREYGIPAVVGCWNATHSINDGDLIIVDGNNGMVEILEQVSAKTTA